MRLLLIIPTLFILSTLVFLSVRFLPGDVIDAMALELESLGVVVDREALEHKLGLDVPVWVQYGRWMGGILLHGTLGESLRGVWRVEERIIGRLPVTLELGLLAIVIGLVIALPVGIYSAIRRNTAADYAGRSIAIIGLATPNFWLGVMVMLYPATLVGLVATDAADSVHRRPAGESRHVPHSQRDSGDGLGGRDHADDAHHDAGGAPARLYPDGLVQGTPGAGRDYPAHHQKCPHPDQLGDPDRPAVADPGWGRRYHGEHLQPAGARATDGECPQWQRLPGGHRSQPGVRHRGGAVQSPDRLDLSLFRSQGKV